MTVMGLQKKLTGDGLVYELYPGGFFSGFLELFYLLQSP